MKNSGCRFCDSRMLLFSIVLLQIKDRLPIAVQSLTLNGMDTGHTGVGDLPKGFSSVHIGNVNFNRWDRYGLQRIQNGNGGMGLGSRIDDNTVVLSVGSLNRIHDCPFVIGLKAVHLSAMGSTVGLDLFTQVFVILSAVNTRFPLPQQVQVGAVHN